MENFEDYYEILGVSPEATAEELKRVYRDKCWILSPDRMAGAPESARKRAEKELARVNQAYDILKDPGGRRNYHAKWLKLKAKPKPVVKPSHIRFGNMTPGQTKKTTFVIENSGGPYDRIQIPSPSVSWLKVVRWRSLGQEELPLEVEIEATGLKWGETSTEDIVIRLDDQETRVTAELRVKAKPIPKSPPKPTAPPRQSGTILCPVCHKPKIPNEAICSNCGIRSCPKGHVLNSRICSLCGWVDHNFKQQTTSTAPVPPTPTPPPGQATQKRKARQISFVAPLWLVNILESKRAWSILICFAVSWWCWTGIQYSGNSLSHAVALVFPILLLYIIRFLFRKYLNNYKTLARQRNISPLFYRIRKSSLLRLVIILVTITLLVTTI